MDCADFKKSNKNTSEKKQEYLLRLLSVTTFIIFFQLYMVAPLIPELSTYFKVAEQKVGLIVPAFLIPYGVFTLFYGLLADKAGTKLVILASFLSFGFFTIITASSQSIGQLIIWRLLTGVAAGGVIPISLAWIGQTYPYEKRGRPLGFIFGAVAGGGAFGSSFGVFLESFIGWRILFLGVGSLSVLIWIILFLSYRRMSTDRPAKEISFSKVLNGYKRIFLSIRGRNAYFFVFLNGIFTSGVYTWLALYFDRVFSLNGWQIGLALLGYGIPGFIFGPAIGRLTDKVGRSKLLPIGLLIGGISAFVLIFHFPLSVAKIAVITLSIGFDLTQPLLAGIISQVGKERSGQSMSLMAFMLFTGFGLGSYLFGLILSLGFPGALLIFSLFQVILAMVAFRIFRHETFTN